DERLHRVSVVPRDTKADALIRVAADLRPDDVQADRSGALVDPELDAAAAVRRVDDLGVDHAETAAVRVHEQPRVTATLDDTVAQFEDLLAGRQEDRVLDVGEPGSQHLHDGPVARVGDV